MHTLVVKLPLRGIGRYVDKEEGRETQVGGFKGRRKGKRKGVKERG